MSTGEDFKKLPEKLEGREATRVAYDYYRGKMPGIEKTHKDSKDPKKKERWDKNVIK